MDILNVYGQPLLLSFGAAAAGAYGNQQLQFSNRRVDLPLIAVVSGVISILGLFLIYPSYGLEGLVGFSVIGGAGGLFLAYMLNPFG